MSLTTRVVDDVSDQDDLTFYGDTVLNVKEKLVSTLVRRDSDSSISMSLQKFGTKPVCISETTLLLA